MADQKVRIRFEGTTLECRPDTTVAVALWEGGVRHLSCSPKYGRSRGVTCARGHCTACLMRVDSVPNVRTCEIPVRDGMEVARQDAGAFYAAPMQKILSAGHAFFPVGFYYKWFTRPPFVSRFFLDRIRPLTGIGRLPGVGHSPVSLPPAATNTETAPSSPRDLGLFDTLVVGAGPSGLFAAAQAPGRVLLVDDHLDLGGQRYGALKSLAERPDPVLDLWPTLGSALKRIEDARASCHAKDLVTFLGGSKAIAGYQPDGLLLRHENRLQTVRFKSLIWAAGALDSLGLFPGNDTPGLIGPRALYRLLVRDGLRVAGRHVLVAGGGLDLWLSALLLDSSGARVSLVVTEGGRPQELSAAQEKKWPMNTGLELERIAAKGPEHLRAFFTPPPSHGPQMESHLVMDAHMAVICGRGKPAYDIPYQLGADLRLQPDLGGFALNPSCRVEPGRMVSTLPGGNGLVVAGEAAGTPGDTPSPAGAEVEKS